MRALGNTCGRQTFTQFEFGAAEVHRAGTTAAVPLPRGRRRDLEAPVGERTRAPLEGEGGEGAVCFIRLLSIWLDDFYALPCLCSPPLRRTIYIYQLVIVRLTLSSLPVSLSLLFFFLSCWLLFRSLRCFVCSGGGGGAQLLEIHFRGRCPRRSGRRHW